MAKYKLSLVLDLDTQANLPEVTIKGDIEALEGVFGLIPDDAGEGENDVLSGHLTIEKVLEPAVDPL